MAAGGSYWREEETISFDSFQRLLHKRLKVIWLIKPCGGSAVEHDFAPVLGTVMQGCCLEPSSAWKQKLPVSPVDCVGINAFRIAKRCTLATFYLYIYKYSITD